MPTNHASDLQLRLKLRVARRRHGPEAIHQVEPSHRAEYDGLSINRGLVSVGYELHESRGKTAISRRSIDLDPTTVSVLSAWKTWQAAERGSVGIEPTGWVFADVEGNPIHPDSISQTFERIANRAGVRRIRLHDVRLTHGTLLIKPGVPAKVVSERLGHGNPASIDTYQHVLPGMQADAARTFEQLVTGTGRRSGRNTPVEELLRRWSPGQQYADRGIS